MLLRRLAALALVAALCGAPSPASAAGNALSAASVSPHVGTTTTVFAFAVRYDGKFAATSVTADVAGQTIPMSLTAGDGLAGLWAAAASLPAGSWTVTFTASAELGNPPMLAGPTITVLGPTVPASAYASATAEPNSETPRGGNDTGRAEPATEAPAGPPASGPVTAPEQSAAVPTEAPAAADVAPAAPAPPAASSKVSTPANGPAAAPAPGDAGPTGTEPQQVTTGGGVPGSQATLAAAPVGPEPSQPAAGTEPDEERLVDTVLLVGLAGVATVALLGTAFLLARRGRRDEREAAATAMARTAATLERRTVRRAKVRLADDPIVAALGVGNDAPPRRPRRRARQVASGPGERPNRPPPT